ASPELRAEFERRLKGDLPAGLGDAIATLKQKLVADKPKIATRKASQLALEVINKSVPETIGGSADLTGSNLTNTPETLPFKADDRLGRYLRYGIREHEMAACMNGIALHRGLIPYGGTFLVFTDYARPAIRLSAIMGQRVIYVMTHDSIGLGEDGPTHQPVEHLSALRAIPNLQVLRPADAVETLECWQVALETTTGPSVLALSRQNLPPLRTENTRENLCARGAYVIAGEAEADATIFATGSEVAIAVESLALLAERGISGKVVSVPSMERFLAQPEEYRASVVGRPKARVAVEAGIAMSWGTLLGEKGRFVGMHSFGASAPYEALYEHFGITPKAIVEAVATQL
ncbi:MAG TPA: transketolase, partial [Alphaproteobacteria bacterium]|nr:transketolase [Alphaproteobacteria bacterium]